MGRTLFHRTKEAVKAERARSTLAQRGDQNTFNWCKQKCLREKMPQVQLRVPEGTLEELDRWVKEGRFKSRSDAIKTIIAFYQERERARSFYKMLVERSREVKKKPELLIPLEELE